MSNFAAIGVAGFVAPRHLKAIKETGNRLVAAVDPRDSVGILDQFGYDVQFFTEIERFDRHIERLRNSPDAVQWVSIMSPNYLHDAHCRMALRAGADAICEKPLVINPWNVDQLELLEQETGHKVYTVLQLRLHPVLTALKRNLDPNKRHNVILKYVTPRGQWYHTSWKGNTEKSGGIATNIGVHLFDLLLWLFGDYDKSKIRINISDKQCMAGTLQLKNADVTWFLSIDVDDLPNPGLQKSYRSINIDGAQIEFSDGFTDLHTKVYQATLSGNGFSIADARKAIELTYDIRSKADG